MTWYYLTPAEISIISMLIAAASSIIVALNFIYLSTPNLYVTAKTQFLRIADNESYESLPDRVKDFLQVNNIPLGDSIRGVKPLLVRYLDIDLGNAGPGIARKIKWSLLNYANSNYKDTNEEMGFLMGPQGHLTLIGILPTKYKWPGYGGEIPFTTFNYEEKKWTLEVTYTKSRRKIPSKRKFRTMLIEINQDGKIVKSEFIKKDIALQKGVFTSTSQ